MSLPNDFDLTKLVDGYGIQKLIELIQNQHDYMQGTIDSAQAEIDALPTFWVGTQEEYDNIELKDDSTLYFIKEE